MTPEQEKKLAEAIGDGSNFPSITDDPEVNYEVDRKVKRIMGFDQDVPWSQLNDDLKKVYQVEVDLMKENDQ